MEANEPSFDPATRLRAFLRERRLRMRPETLGLPCRQSRTAGLRREDVAELLGVSPLWYALFESAASGRRFSGAFLERVQEILGLDRAERAEFMTLVVTSGHASPDIEARWRHSRWELVMTGVADKLRQINTASTLEMAIELAGSSLHSLLVELPDASQRG
jgi:transcriptional regulator with XRE-family HTH domain